MNIVIEVDAAQLERAMRAAPVKVTFALNQWVAKTTMRGERHMKQELADNTDTGQLQSSVRSSIGNLRGEVRPTAKHAKFVHDGRRPGAKMPPFREGTPLNRWAKKRGIEPFVVARSISRKGIKADKYVDITHRAIKPWAEREGNAVLSQIVRSI